jgi:all-trans-retinol 13,14-reductase
MTVKYDYDAIIIGAGIGGLVCGCYLAKAGMKTLILEKNAKPGGYCTSFKRNNFVFDSCVHSFGSCASQEALGQIIKELNIDIQLIRSNPSDVVITPEYEVEIKNSIEESMCQLIKIFPNEKKIKQFFSLFSFKSGLQLYYLLRGKTFKNLLDKYFSDFRIKAILSIFLANCGISPSKASAFTTILFLKSYVFNGGYYPVGGMQRFTDSLVNFFLKSGGNMICRQEVIKIKTINNVAKDIILKNGENLFSRLIVSNIDLRYTFLNLIGKEKLKTQFVSRLKQLLPSSSAFIVYLGIKKYEDKMFKNALGIWRMPDDYNIENTLDQPLRNKISKDNFVFCSFLSNLDKTINQSETQTIRLIVNAPFKSKEYWNKNRNLFSEDLINRTNLFFPRLKSHILFKEDATPQTLYGYTYNYKGAMCGWLNTASQNENDLLKKCGIKNLYFVGHWVPEKYGQGGIAMVAYSGKKIANKILFDIGKNKK